MENHVTIAEAGRLLGISERTAYRWAKSGKLPAHQHTLTKTTTERFKDSETTDTKYVVLNSWVLLSDVEALRNELA